MRRIGIDEGLALLLGVFALGNGLWMLADPPGWYARVPGVATSGPFNQHFIRDIGLVYAMTGAAFFAGLRWRGSRAALWAAAAFWLGGHALFHFWEVAVGICSTSAIPRDFPGVTLPAIVAAVLAWRAARLSRRARA